MVREPDATMQPTLQDNQLMSKHRVLGFKPQLRLEWRGQDGQNETKQPDHSASLGDFFTSSTRIRFSVHTVDEKLSIQALERAQGYLKLPNGRALTGQSHDYKRHGTTTLFAALEVATGKVIATHSKRRRRVEFLDFMNGITAAFPNRKLHVILDNLNTHKKNEHWLKAHPNVQFHFTPTSASWLNQVEVWFSILQGQSLSGASFTSLKQ